MAYSPLITLYLGQTATTTTPSVTLNSPSNGGSSSGLTPTLEFTGVTNNAQAIPYEIQVDTSNTFNSVAGGSNPAVVQRGSGEDNNGGTGKVTVAFGSNNTAGNAIIIAAAVGWTTTSQLGQPQDTRGNIYTEILDVPGGSDFTSQRWWIAYNIGGGPNTITLTDGFFSTNLHAYEVSGVGLVNSPDQTAHQFQTSTTSLSTTATPATNFANELCLAVFCDDITAETFTLGAGYSNLVNQPNASFSSASEEKVVTSTGAQTATMTIGSASTTSLGVIMTFANYGTPLIDASSPGPSFVGNNGSGSTAAAGTTATFTTTRTIRAGEQVLVAAATRNNTNGAVVSISVGSLNLSKDHGSSAGIVAYETWSAPVTGDIVFGSTVTVTWTTSGSQDRLGYCFSLSGIPSSSYVRGTPADAHAGSTSATVTSDANPLAADMAIVILTEDVSNSTVTPTTGYALAGQVTGGTNGTALAVAYKPLTAAGASTAAFTLSTSNNWAEMIIVYKANPTAFADITNSGDISPFPSSDQVGYTVGSALTNGTVYYWRVRQIAPPGNPNYLSGYSSTFSFTASTGGSVLTKTQSAVARIANNLTKTQTAISRIANNKTKTQTAITRIANSKTKTQTAISRIVNTLTKTQSAVARIQKTVTKTQSAVARIATNNTKTQTAISRIANNFTKTQTAISRIANNKTKTQSAVSRIQVTLTKTQGAISRIQNNRTKTQSATANIVQANTKTFTQSAIARIANTLTKTQSAIARIQKTVTKTQTAVARISQNFTKTQSAIARIAQTNTKTQSAVARIAKTVTKTQTAVSRVANNRTKTQSAVARIQTASIFTKTQAAKARIAQSLSRSQPATAKIIQTPHWVSPKVTVSSSIVSFSESSSMKVANVAGGGKLDVVSSSSKTEDVSGAGIKTSINGSGTETET